MRRYSILFIDDEEVIRESFLKLVDWETYGFDVAGVLKNGELAWEYLCKNDVDIIVTDINMPFMNGISLLENIRRESPKVRVIFLTGYEYFEYAQKAVQLKASDFLLKPVTMEQLLTAVENAAFDIEKEEAAEEAVGRSLELSQGHFLNSLFYGKIERDKIGQTAEKVQISVESKNYRVILGAVDSLKGQKIPEDEVVDLKREIQEKIKQEKERFQEEKGIFFELYFARNIGIQIQMVLVSDQGEEFGENVIEDWAKRILDMGQSTIRYQMTLSVSNSCRRLEEIPDSFKKAESVLQKRHILGIGKVIYVRESNVEKKSPEQIVLPTDTFLYHIRMGMTAEVEKDIERIYETFRNKEYLSLEYARIVTTELAITVFKGESTSKDTSVSSLFYLNLIQQLNTLDEMEHEIKEFALKVTEKRKEGGNHKRITAQKALDYLKNNFEKENLSLNDVADALHISVPYLAVLFKNETNQNFSAHLLKIRMEKAKELLKTTTDTVSEISEKVGYSSSQYFAVSFKKYTGMTPGAYRDQG